jgi:hypothetical protein
MTSHLGLLIVFSTFVSVIFAVLMRDQPRDQLILGARLLGGFVGVALLLAWLIYPLPL